MTHSNHRRGSRESLEGDYVVLIREEKRGPRDKARAAVRILASHNPVSLTTRHFGKPLHYMRDWKGGLGLEELVEYPDPPEHIAAVYENKDDVEKLIEAFKKADLGLSVVVSGVFDEVFDICRKTGTGPHTVNMSLETIGRVELLPDDRMLELTTMCGHGFVGEKLARYLIDKVRKGRMTSKEAALELGNQCLCNFYNPVRAEKIINQYISLQR